MCDSPDLHGVQGVAGGPVHGHFAHDEHHDFGSLVVWQISSEKAWQEDKWARESALRHKDLDLCRRLTAHSLLRLSWFHLHYHTNSLSFTRGAFQLRKLRFGFLYSEQWLLKQTWACEYRSRTQRGQTGIIPMVWMMAFWTILSSLSLPPRPDETLVLEFLLELSPSSKSTLILRCLSRVLNTSSTVGPAVTHTHSRQRGHITAKVKPTLGRKVSSQEKV